MSLFVPSFTRNFGLLYNVFLCMHPATYFWRPDDAVILLITSFSSTIFIFPFKKPLVQTKYHLLRGLYGVAISSYLANVSLIFYQQDDSITFAFVLGSGSLHFLSYLYLSAHFNTRLFFDTSKLIINPIHIFLISILFLITSYLLSPYSVISNWIHLLYSFLASIEASIATSTTEFKRDNVSMKEEADQWCGAVNCATV